MRDCHHFNYRAEVITYISTYRYRYIYIYSILYYGLYGYISTNIFVYKLSSSIEI